MVCLLYDKYLLYILGEKYETMTCGCLPIIFLLFFLRNQSPNFICVHISPIRVITFLLLDVGLHVTKLWVTHISKNDV